MCKDGLVQVAETPAAKFARALDCIQPLLHNQQNRGGTWRIHGIRRDQVMKRVRRNFGRLFCN